MKKNKIISAFLSLCLLVSICIPALAPIISYAVEETVYISNAEEFLDFAKKCSYDAWSLGKTVILKNDISLDGISFEPIPSFSGTFDGGGMTISGLDIQGSYSPAGLFASLEKDGIIKNLTVTGSVCPEGDRAIIGGIVGENYGRIENCTFIGNVIGKNDVGGIAGINRFSGSIVGCKASAQIIGEARTGGIAGRGEGLISSCISSSKVNTISITPSLSLEDINISLTLDITKLPSLNSLSMTDMGGICGYSTGMIMGCTNNGSVGYPHVGYNVGGIAGRSSGHLSGNTNNASVYGRKEVGGIIGQIEPHVSYQLSEDLLKSLKEELDRLGILVDGAVENADESIPDISGRLDSILNGIDGATDSLDDLLEGASNYGDDFIGEINRASEILSEVISQLEDIGKDIPELSKLFGNGLDSLENALDGLEEISSIGADSISDLILTVQDAASAFEKISEGIDKIDKGIEALSHSLTINDKEGARAALNSILNGLGDAIRCCELVAAAVDSIADVMGDATWMADTVSQLNKMATVFKSISLSMSEIYDATLEIDENIDIYWDKLTDGGDELIKALGYFSDAMVSLSESLDLLDQGLNNIKDGLETLLSAIQSSDQTKIDQAIKQINDGTKKLVEASDKITSALSELSERIESFDSADALNSLKEIVDSLGAIADSAAEATEAVAMLTEGLTTILSNVKIDSDSITNGGSLILGGIGNTTDALKKMKDAIQSMSDGMVSLNNAIDLIKNSVSVKDAAATKAELDKAYLAIGKMTASIGELSDILIEATKTMEEARIWSEDLIASVKELTGSASMLTKALVKIQDGVESLKANLAFDGNLFTEGTDLIRQGISDAGTACSFIKDSLLHLSDALTDLDGAADKLPDFISDLKNATSRFSESFNKIAAMTEKVNILLGYLKGVDTIQLPTVSESIKAEAGKLFAYISTIEAELKHLNSDITSLSEDLIERIGKINKLFNKLSDNIVDMIYGLNDGNIIDNNVTEEEIDSITSGKIFSCVNYGSVHGDINVGGIGGAIGIEYTLDPEDDMSVELTVTQKKQYRLKAVIHACQNYGNITAKRDGAGGICGKMDFGLIYGCESYSTIRSESGNYVGGVAGISGGLISQCFVKSTLAGGKYVGGIVGAGVKEDFSGDSSMVRNCYSMVEIISHTQYAGAIAGANIGQYSENLFVSNTLAGIDRVSYLGKAEPISYEELIKRRSIPMGFYSFVLEFVADGKVISTIEFDYGESFDSSVFPEIPKKDGHYGYWDKTELTNLIFDTTVNVIYKPYTTAIGSEEKRDDGREIFLIQGEFTDGGIITVSKNTDTQDLTLSDKFFTKDTLIESWVIEIPMDALESNTVHFLPKNEHARIFARLDGKWQEIATSQFGSYLTFEVSDERIELAIVEHSVKPLPIILISSAILVAISVTAVLVIVNKKKNTAKTPEKEEIKV